MKLQVLYCNATGRMPPTTARRDMLGPFARIVAACLCLLRAPVSDNDPDRTGLAVQLINDLDRARRKDKLVGDFRRILGPLREADRSGTISAVGRLIEDGKAIVVCVQPGNEADDLPEQTALVEFEDVGKLAFFIPPSRCRTVAVKSRPRARIVRLAQGIHAINAPDQAARVRRKRASEERARNGPRSDASPLSQV
jgi:hypothetical protein